MPTAALPDPLAPSGVVADAVRAAATQLGAEVAFGGLATDAGTVPLLHVARVTPERFAALAPRPGRGLGGRVLAERRPCAVDDYGHARTITRDFAASIGAEGLRGVGCAPILDPTGVVGLLYVGSRRPGAPSGRMLDALTALADDTAARLNERRIAELEEELALRRGHVPPASAVPTLTGREREVLALLADGCSNREIADRLVIAEPTVKGHVGRLMTKLGARSRLRVVARAGRLGLLGPAG